MTWLTDHWLDLLGWVGSALLIYSLLQTRVLRFRVLNLIGCVMLVVFNAVAAVWPMFGVNVVLSVINVWFIVAFLRHRHDDKVFEVLGVRPEDEYLRHVVRVHAGDIEKFNPGFMHDPFAPDQSAFLIQKGDETVGVVLIEADGPTARILLDYVTPRYRDVSPGEFVWRRSDLLADKGFTTVLTRPGMVDTYYHRIGFVAHGDAWVLDLHS